MRLKKLMEALFSTGFFMTGGGSEVIPQITNSLRLRSSASAYLTKTYPSTGDRKSWTLSLKVKRGTLSTLQSLFSVGDGVTTNGYANLSFTTSNTIRFASTPDGATNSSDVSTTAVFRDVAAYYHIDLVVDTTQATASDRVKLWVNGARQTLVFTTAPALNALLPFNLGGAYYHRFGMRIGFGDSYFDGLLARACFVDGQALDPSSFGYTDPATNQWVSKSQSTCKAVVDAGGTNSFMLDFDNGTGLTTLGYDKSSKGNNWTLNNVSLTAGATYDWLTDTPTNNFCTLNPLIAGATGITNGNLSATGTARGTFSTANVSDCYWEVTATSVSVVSGLVDVNGGSYTVAVPNGSTYGFRFSKATNVLSYSSDGSTYTGIAGGLIGDLWPFVSGGATVINFGQRPFAYAPPTGFKTLCTKNLPAPSIKLPKKHFDILTWVGNATYPRSITGAEFTPDFVWPKTRSIGYNHVVYDVVRGVGNNKALYTNATEAEGSQTTIQNLTSFDSGGFSLGSVSGTNILNDSGHTRVAWLWKAGGAPVANNDGTIASQVSANVAAGFSIVTFTGTGAAGSVGHGLGVAPSLIIYKARGAAGSWVTGHKSLNGGVSPWNYTLFLEVTNAQGVTANAFNNTAPTSSQFTVGPFANNGVSQVAYCFAEVPGFSKLGSYIGNGSADGPFVWCGFRPRWVLVKRTDTAGNWVVFDSARDTENVTDLGLYPNLANAEDSGARLHDLLSNGFKVRNTLADHNTSGGTYIFMAFAEAPFNYANAR
jgi:hypothetical protein